MTDMVPYEPVARLNVTFNGQNGDYPDPVDQEMADGDIKQVATEAIRTGYIPGIDANPGVNLADFVVDRFPATEELPPRLMVRPKTPFGDAVDVYEEVKTHLEDLGCKVYEGAPGIWYVDAPGGHLWDMTIPQKRKRA